MITLALTITERAGQIHTTVATTGPQRCSRRERAHAKAIIASMAPVAGQQVTSLEYLNEHPLERPQDQPSTNGDLDDPLWDPAPSFAQAFTARARGVVPGHDRKGGAQ